MDKPICVYLQLIHHKVKNMSNLMIQDLNSVFSETGVNVVTDLTRSELLGTIGGGGYSEYECKEGKEKEKEKEKKEKKEKYGYGCGCDD
jgi:hypothetical protein